MARKKENILNIIRNENIMGSSHPWKYRISKQLGNTPQNRRQTILKHYEFIDMERQTKDLIKRRNVKGEVSNEVII